MHNKRGSSQKRRSGSSTAKESSQPFDPTAYAALIAIAAAEKRLRASHSRGASSSTARPSSLHRSLHEPSPDPPSAEAARSHFTRNEARVEAIIARHRRAAPPADLSVAPKAKESRTLLEQLACASESDSSVAVSDKEDSVALLELSADREKWTRPPMTRSFSPPAEEPTHDVLRTSSPPPAKVAQLGEERKSGSEVEEVTVELRDASPLREQSVAGTAGVSYRVSTAESVHAVAQQLNFALYQ